MITDFYKQILAALIVCIIILILAFFLAAVTRRVLNARKYAELDRYRKWCRLKITTALQSGSSLSIVEDLRAQPLSLQWHAVEEILFDLIEQRKYRKEVRQLFYRLGYRAYYEKKLKSSRVTTKAAAVDKVGKMLSEFSTGKLIEVLNSENNPEILTVTIRALCRNNYREGLKAILERLPDLYGKNLISQKTIETSLVHCSADAIPLLVAYGRKYGNPKITASLLEVLSRLPANPMALYYAGANLGAYDAEVRARAIKVLGRREASEGVLHPALLLPLLEDRVWFVRLQAANALGTLRYERAVDKLGALLLDQNWQVRNAAARALTHIGDASLDVFLNILKYTDRYAKGSICEELERTNFTQKLIENLTSSDKRTHEKSREILRIMHSLNFSTPIYDYLNSGKNNGIKHEMASLILETAVHSAGV
ncbi:MAG TPA: HEAT repeat domain-containing protein [Nitrospirota bacterium]|nr:HEAT repeat domain-containing protein [Nitrospirota bacterium]